MRGKDDCLVAGFEETHDAFIKNVLANVWVYGRQRVVQQLDVAVLVNSTCQGNALLLTTREIDASFSNLSCIACWQDVQIIFKRAGVNYLIVPIFVIIRAECNVVC